MSLSFENHPKFIPATRSFFERCKVTAVHISLPYLTSSPSMSFWLIPMPHLQHLAIENRSPIDQSWQLSLPSNDCSLDFWPRLDEVYLTNCNLDQQALPQLVSIHEPKILWVHEPRWDGQARDQAEESLRQYSGKLVWVEKWDEMPDVSRKLATGCFLSP
ncbi:hypothetical protein FS749_010627 [Ceratobasidium sp. UAMH 11750]|nr:hypothetical protein FS749_010627 [Ceratobasidium sp. UAMH 11750]